MMRIFTALSIVLSLPPNSAFITLSLFPSSFQLPPTGLYSSHLTSLSASSPGLQFPRFHISSLSPADFQRLYDHPEASPCVIEGIFSAEMLEQACGDVVSALEGAEVEYQVSPHDNILMIWPLVQQKA